MKGRKLLPFFFLIATAVASSETLNTAELLEKIEVTLQQQDSLVNLLAKVDKRLNDLQRVNTERLQKKVQNDVASLRWNDKRLEERIQNEVTGLKQKDQNVEKQLQSLDQRLKSHQTDVRSIVNKVQLVEDIVSRHEDLVNSSVAVQNKDISDRLTNLERDILVGNENHAILDHKIKEVTGELRQNEAEIKLQNMQLSSLNAECSNVSMTMKDLRAQGKFFRADFSHDVIVESSTNRTALHMAVWNGKLEQVKELIRNGSNIEAQDYKKWRPLHLATWKDDVEVIRELLASGADVNSISNNGYTPLHLAARKSENYTDLLLSNGANIDAKDIFGETPLFKACWSRKRIKIVELLVKRGANINAVRNWRSTPLHSAAEDGFLDYVKLLVEKGADVHAKTFLGETAIDLANINKHQDVVNYLKQHM